MSFIRNNLVAIIIFALCIGGFFVYQNNFSSSPSDTRVSTVASSTPPGADLLVSLADLRAVNLDPGLFADPVFASLVDFGTVLPQPPSIGRGDPFAPLSGESVSSGSSVPAANISTNAPPSIAPTTKKK